MLRWTHPSGVSIDDILQYLLASPDGGSERDLHPGPDFHPTAFLENPYYTSGRQTNGSPITYRLRVVMKSTAGYTDVNGAWSPIITVTPNIPAPTSFSATAGDGQVTLHWKPHLYSLLMRI